MKMRNVNPILNLTILSKSFSEVCLHSDDCVLNWLSLSVDRRKEDEKDSESDCENEDEKKHLPADDEKEGKNQIFDDFEDAKSEGSVDEFVDAVENLLTTDDDRWDARSDVHSVRSVSTAATIEPQVIHSKVKNYLNKRSKLLTRRRCLAKGEASAVTRKRNENRAVIREYTNASSVWEWC